MDAKKDGRLQREQEILQRLWKTAKKQSVFSQLHNYFFRNQCQIKTSTFCELYEDKQFFWGEILVDSRSVKVKCFLLIFLSDLCLTAFADVAYFLVFIFTFQIKRKSSANGIMFSTSLSMIGRELKNNSVLLCVKQQHFLETNISCLMIITR